MIYIYGFEGKTAVIYNFPFSELKNVWIYESVPKVKLVLSRSSLLAQQSRCYQLDINNHYQKCSTAENEYTVIEA